MSQKRNKCLKIKEKSIKRCLRRKRNKCLTDRKAVKSRKSYITAWTVKRKKNT